MGRTQLSSPAAARRLAGGILVTATAALVLAIPPVASAKTCHAGVHRFGSVNARTFCGPASAHITLPGKSATIRGGKCQKTSQYFTINIGTAVLGSAPNKPHYLGITVGSVPGGGGAPAGNDGTYSGGAVSFVINHRGYALINTTVILAGNRTKGSFSGTIFGGGQASGTFSCG